MAACLAWSQPFHCQHFFQLHAGHTAPALARAFLGNDASALRFYTQNMQRRALPRVVQCNAHRLITIGNNYFPCIAKYTIGSVQQPKKRYM